MNRGPIYTTQMDQDSYIQYYNTTPSDHHYMLGHNTEPMSIIPQQQQHGNSTSHNHNSSSHPYNMAPGNKSTVNNNNNKMLTSSHGDPMVPMNHPSPYSINHMTSASPLGPPPMVHGQSPQMMQTDQNRFCKNTSSPPNHYDTASMGPYHQTPGNMAGNHHSPSSNHFHSESFSNDTDGSSGSYAPSPMTKNNMAKNMNMISPSHSFRGMNCSMSDWGSGGLSSSTNISTSSNNNNNNCNSNSPASNNSQMGSQMNAGGNMQHQQQTNEHHFSYLEPGNSSTENYVTKITSPSAKPSLLMAKPYLVEPVAPQEKREIEKNNNCSPIIDVPPVPGKKIESQIKNEESDKKITSTKRHLIIFKVIEQVLDPLTNNVITETIIKNEQLTIPVEFSTHSTNTLVSGSSEAIRLGSELSDGSIGKSNESKSKSVELIEVKPKLASSSSSNKSPEKSILVTKKKNVEAEKSEAATALLSLHTTPSKTTSAVSILSAETKITPVKETRSITEKPITTKEIKENNIKSDEITISECKILKPGVKVIAKWKDKNFYPAQIVKQCETHKWTVRFEDMATRNLFESEIIRIEYLLPKQGVMVKISDDLYKLATIMKVIKHGPNNSEFDLRHFHEDDKTMVTRRYPLKDLFLNAEQGAQVLNKVSKPGSQGAVYADVDLDNIVSGKRSRSAKSNKTGNNGKSSQDEDSSSDSPGGKKRRPIISDSKDSITETTNDRSRRTTIVNQSNFGDYHENSLAFSPVPSNRTIAATTPKSELETMFGPIPESDSKLFQNFRFILTSGHRKNDQNLDLSNSKPEGSTPFDKQYLAKQLTSGAGKVFESFDEMKSQSNANSECICIADTYSRSVKFLQCLSAGIPIISHRWVIDCCRQNKTLDRNSYTLPSGYSLITKSLSSDKNIFKKSSVLFKGVKFSFGTEFVDMLQKLWSPVLLAAQAKIINLDTNKSIQRGQIDIIIGDATCPDTLVERAKQLKIPIVSSEYVVQCLIIGRKLPYDACPEFSYLKQT